LFGVVYGTLLVNAGKSLFSDNFPATWLLCMGALYIGVVLLFPNGLVGGWDWWRKKIWPGMLARLKEKPPRTDVPDISNAATKGENS
jgi:urea transport system permease protein